MIKLTGIAGEEIYIAPWQVIMIETPRSRSDYGASISLVHDVTVRVRQKPDEVAEMLNAGLHGMVRL